MTEILVLEVYRITLLSNTNLWIVPVTFVLEVYRITLLSNNLRSVLYDWLVLEVYRITLLSNLALRWVMAR